MIAQVLHASCIILIASCIILIAQVLHASCILGHMLGLLVDVSTTVPPPPPPPPPPTGAITMLISSTAEWAARMSGA